MNTADPAVATIDPSPDTDVCEGNDCDVTNGLVAIDPHDSDYPRRTVCSSHLVEYLEALQ